MALEISEMTIQYRILKIAKFWIEENKADGDRVAQPDYDNVVAWKGS